MDALLDLPMVLTLDQIGRMRECLGPDRAAAAFSVADEVASMGWMPYLFAPADVAAGALASALRSFARQRAELFDVLSEAMSLEEISIFRVSWARRLAGAAADLAGDRLAVAAMTRALDEFEALAVLASDLPPTRGRSVPELRRAAARMDFCLGAVLQFGGAVAAAQRRRSVTMRSESTAPQRIAELARQGLSAARLLRARLLTRRVSAGR